MDLKGHDQNRTKKYSVEPQITVHSKIHCSVGQYTVVQFCTVQFSRVQYCRTHLKSGAKMGETRTDHPHFMVTAPAAVHMKMFSCYSQSPLMWHKVCQCLYHTSYDSKAILCSPKYKIVVTRLTIVNRPGLAKAVIYKALSNIDYSTD